MRKKIIVFLIVVFCLGSNFMVSTSYGQESGGQSGGFTAELDLSMFDPAYHASIKLKPEFLKFRYFVNDEVAIRLTTWGRFSGDQKEDRESTFNSHYFAVRPGFEYHLVPGEGEFSAYIGVEGIFDQAGYNFDTNVGVPVTGAWDIDNIRNFENRGYMSFGGALVGGADIYMAGNFYVGTEVGLVFTHSIHDEVQYGNELYLEESATSTFNIDLTRALRVGFLIN